MSTSVQPAIPDVDVIKDVDIYCERLQTSLSVYFHLDDNFWKMISSPIPTKFCLDNKITIPMFLS